jgi:hypothetical protein
MQAIWPQTATTQALSVTQALDVGAPPHVPGSHALNLPHATRPQSPHACQSLRDPGSKRHVLRAYQEVRACMSSEQPDLRVRAWARYAASCAGLAKPGPRVLVTLRPVLTEFCHALFSLSSPALSRSVLSSPDAPRHVSYTDTRHSHRTSSRHPSSRHTSPRRSLQRYAASCVPAPLVTG